MDGDCLFNPSGLLLLHNSLNRNRFKDKIMQQFKVLQRPLRSRKDARRCRRRILPRAEQPPPCQPSFSTSFPSSS
ncbi:hypothetical protein GFL95_02760 [Rhizobium leguminosarum bv. viciae]|nr:hypothetical protein [Rhizobium leguminosarum bv. viciae]TBZ34230.1 hypothetical protein E0H44_32010 [Rhizobium leguminosarum bv. viciae]